MKVRNHDLTELDRIDLWWDDDAPVLVGFTVDGRGVGYRIPPNEQAALVRKLAGYLANYHRKDAS